MKERIKTIALVANIVLMMVLFGFSILVSVEMSENTGPFYAVSRWLRGETAPRQEVARTEAPTEYPIRMVAVEPEDGLAVYYQRGDLKAQFDGLRTSFDEALSTAQEPRMISEQEYRGLVMGSRGFLFDYDAAMPLYALRLWAGAPEAEGFDQELSQLCLAIAEDGVALAFRGGGAYYRCATMANAEAVSAFLDSCDTSEDAVFAGNLGGPGEPFLALAPEEVVESSLLTLPSYDARVPSFITAADNTTLELLKCFSMNPYMENHYESEEGVTYGQGNYVLSLRKNGQLQFSVTGGEGLKPEGGGLGMRQQAVGLIDRARSAVEGVLKLAGGNWGLSLRSITPLNEEGNYTIVFGCTVDGVPLGSGGRDAVVAQVENGRITALEMTVMSLAPADEVTLLPYRQAVAALDAPADGRLRLLPRYSRTGGRLTPYLSYTIQEGARAGGMEKG